jgi:FAD/FMN-containing dehydrogenase
MFSGASNIDGGLTIDLLKLNQVTVSADQTQTSIGSGNRWVDVYSALDLKGLSVIGGRVADIGVGGLTLGGGMSFFSGRYGWACDNVNMYEVCVSQRVGEFLGLTSCRLSSPTDPSVKYLTRHIQTSTLPFEEEETTSELSLDLTS